ncbi:MAG: hypothetical protein NTV46_21380 [Verrucomicrobia bacterium]|nr:hypothetical protein [Verrucomicrobiota bacterium]
MKPLLSAVMPLLLLNSCVFESPFEAVARIPTDPRLLGRWEEVRDKPEAQPDRMLVLQHSANEYVVEYPVGAKAMFFRAYTVQLEAKPYIQIQLLGTAEGPAKPADRKYHLLKVSVDGDAVEMRTLDAEVLGKNPGDQAHLKAAFAKHKDDLKLFGDPVIFRRMK